jgi:hypothetical protein
MRHILFATISLLAIDTALAQYTRPEMRRDGLYGGYSRSESSRYHVDNNSAQSTVNPYTRDGGLQRQEAAHLPAYNAFTDNYARPHVRRDSTNDGQSEPNQYRFDTSSDRGSANPYTREQGAQRQESANSPAYNTDHSRTRRGLDPYGLRSR